MKLSKPIGGYFEWHFNPGKPYYNNLIPLNTGRNSFEYLLLANRIKKVYIPYYTCDVLLEPLRRNEIEFSFYSINEMLEPVEVPQLPGGTAFLYTNYFGIKDLFCENLVKNSSGIILDNAQAFYAKPIHNTPTFYSPRKFFGLPDGGYATPVANFKLELPQDYSNRRCDHLLMRAELDPKDGFDCFRSNDKILSGNKVSAMSNLTTHMLAQINYNWVSEKRITNFNYLHQNLCTRNRLKINNFTGVPMVYPFWSNSIDLREKLLKNLIYTATYWPGVIESAGISSIEGDLVNYLVPLPIDQRYNLNDMKRILEVILT